MGKSQGRVQAALAAIHGDLPFRLLGIDSDVCPTQVLELGDGAAAPALA